MDRVLQGLDPLPTICGQQSNFDTALCIDRWDLNLIKSQFAHAGGLLPQHFYSLLSPLFLSPPIQLKITQKEKDKKHTGWFSPRILSSLLRPPSLFDNCNLTQLHYSLHFHYRPSLEGSQMTRVMKKWLWLWRFSFSGLAEKNESKKRRTPKYQTKCSIAGVRLMLTRLSPQRD